ncbi:C4-dicarboxylate ABC transporter permease [Alphaproteobacteria bacterium KMM 3653]|uniref:TRAP transporter small permease protein n=1 Tax=Harenicola maris TaxID=2841044 RepID=A0AAP2CQ09_9RHOB|nr:C4-dicarboxylate ABC transporter permease [Harenicola maris]
MGLVEAWGGTFIGWLAANFIEAFYNLAYAVTHPSLWLGWLGGLDTVEQKESMVRFMYYGGSTEFFFVVLILFLMVTAVGLAKREIMWGYVRGLEGFANVIGRIFAWAGLIMVLQQIAIVFLQRIFTQSTISLSPGITFDISWWAEGLKFHNALLVALCCAYTFVQGSHVRVDLVYSAVGHRAKRIIDMLGSIFFMMPAMVLVWMYGWFFMWRHLATPKVSASDKLELMLKKARILKWNVETIGFSPNGFNAYFLFKLLMIMFAAMVMLQAVAFFYRSYLELVEGEDSINKYKDIDSLGDETAETAAAIH